MRAKVMGQLALALRSVTTLSPKKVPSTTSRTRAAASRWSGTAINTIATVK